MVEHLKRYEYEPVISYLVESLSSFLPKENLFINNNNSNYVVENIYSFIYFDPNVSEKHYFVNNNIIYERFNDNIRVVEYQESLMLPEIFKRINDYVQRPNVVIENNKMNIFINETKISFELNESIKKSYVDDVLIEGDPYIHWMQSGAFEPKVYEYLQILREMWENLGSLVEIDFGKRITERNEPGVSSTLFKINENCYIHLFNIYNKHNEFITEANTLQARNVIFEFMQYDISESLYKYMDKVTSQIGQLKKDKALINEQIY